MSPSTLHDLAKAGQVSALEDYLQSLDDPSEAINSRDALKRTALHLAAWAGHCDAVALLLKQPGIQIAAPAQDGMTALHFAVMKGREDVVEKLLDSGARVNGKNVKGRNALHLAAMAGERGVVSTLLKHQANVLAMDKRGNSARSLCKDVDIQDILEEAEKKAREKTKRKRESVPAAGSPPPSAPASKSEGKKKDG